MNNYLKLSLYFIFYLLLTWSVADNFFLGDTIQLGAKHADFYFSSKFDAILLPDAIDSGHIPAFGAYLAVIWFVFGKSLVVSHFAMMPFLFGLVVLVFIFSKKVVSPQYVHPTMILILADATLLSQASLISPDVVLMFFFILGLNSLLL